jgi:hypothetical protein
LALWRDLLPIDLNRGKPDVICRGVWGEVLRILNMDVYILRHFHIVANLLLLNCI